MGIIKRGVLGGFSKKIANVVGGSWKGIAYMRALPLSVANPNTAGQQEQRGAFSNVVSVAKPILGNIIQPFWNRIASKMSGYNLFVQTNIKAFDKIGLNSPADFNATIGSVTPAVITSMVADVSDGEITFNWQDNTGEGNAQATDEAILFAIDSTTLEVYSAVTLVPRSAGTAVISGVSLTVGRILECYLSFKKQNGDCSYSNHFQTAVIP